MSGHREGSWEYSPTELVGHNFAGYVRMNGCVIAKVLHDRGTQFDGMALAPARDKANGLLLAAAPDLLKALRIAIADSCGGCGECFPCETLNRAGGAR